MLRILCWASRAWTFGCSTRSNSAWLARLLSSDCKEEREAQNLGSQAPGTYVRRGTCNQPVWRDESGFELCSIVISYFCLKEQTLRKANETPLDFRTSQSLCPVLFQPFSFLMETAFVRRWGALVLIEILIFYGCLCFGRWSQRLGRGWWKRWETEMDWNGHLAAKNLGKVLGTSWMFLKRTLADRLFVLGSEVAKVWHQLRFGWWVWGAHTGGSVKKLQIFWCASASSEICDFQPSAGSAFARDALCSTREWLRRQWGNGEPRAVATAAKGYFGSCFWLQWISFSARADGRYTEFVG